jgi:hypothetical protein
MKEYEESIVNALHIDGTKAPKVRPTVILDTTNGLWVSASDRWFQHVTMRANDA